MLACVPVVYHPVNQAALQDVTQGVHMLSRHAVSAFLLVMCRLCAPGPSNYTAEGDGCCTPQQQQQHRRAPMLPRAHGDTVCRCCWVCACCFLASRVLLRYHAMFCYVILLPLPGCQLPAGGCRSSETVDHSSELRTHLPASFSLWFQLVTLSRR